MLDNMKLVPIAGTESGAPVIYKMQKNTPQDYEDTVKAAIRKAIDNKQPVETLQKGASLEKASVSMSSNMSWYDLMVPSRHLIPFLSPIRDSLPRVSRPGSDAARWRVINGITVGAYQASPFINEGARAPLFNFSAVSKSATYSTIGVDGSVTYEAQSSSESFEDALATAQMFKLETLMVQEEDALIGGNNSLALGTANTPTSTATGSGATLPALTYSAYVVGLTYEGYRNSSVANGVATQKSITGPDGKTTVVNGGSGNKSAVKTQAVTLGQTLGLAVTPKNGEVAWAWYVGASGAEKLEAITTVPAATFAAPLAGTGQAATAITADSSKNDGSAGNQVTAFDGLLTQILTAGALSTPNAYVKQMNGVALTSSGRGSIVEIDNAFLYAWNNFKVSYSKIYVNAQELLNITTKCLSNASGPLLRYEISEGGNYDLTAAGTVSFYFNPFAPGGGKKIPVIVHPTLPPGTILMIAETLPPYFKSNATPNVAEVLCRRDYYARDWADRTREYEFGIYSEQVLALYAPFCGAVITGIANG